VSVFDSSALLAYLKSEAGGDAVRERLSDGGVCSAANWSEVAQKLLVSSYPWPAARALLLGFGLAIEPVTMDDAELAARLWEQGSTLSLADRLCLALGARLGTDILTCDKQWSGRAGVVLVR